MYFAGLLHRISMCVHFLRGQSLQKVNHVSATVMPPTMWLTSRHVFFFGFMRFNITWNISAWLRASFHRCNWWFVGFRFLLPRTFCIPSFHRHCWKSNRRFGHYCICTAGGGGCPVAQCHRKAAVTWVAERLCRSCGWRQCYHRWRTIQVRICWRWLLGSPLELISDELCLQIGNFVPSAFTPVMFANNPSEFNVRNVFTSPFYHPWYLCETSHVYTCVSSTAVKSL